MSAPRRPPRSAPEFHLGPHGTALLYASVVALLTVLVTLPGVPHSPAGEHRGTGTRPVAAPSPRPEPAGAGCRTAVRGSLAVVHCHNGTPRPDRLRLHVECARWWDVDTDTAAAVAGPAQTVRLTGRCWKEIRTVWVTHRR
ncbi:hypothetical protein [Streptomyces sp. NPDC058045]|uniref:hypothetical protein n=1 Tax=Streptomyces sp. NPDC058045 TaxID=3346311 RepID=UPI0036F0AE2E